MRYLFRIGLALALGLALMAGCSDENGEGGSGGTAGTGGMAGTGGTAGAGAMAGVGGEGGSGGIDLCEGVRCDDRQYCTVDTCDPVDGMCDFTPVSDGTSCLPFEAASCVDGLCKGAPCDDSSQCTEGSPCSVGTCDPVDGLCDYAPVNDPYLCADGDGVCVAGSCALFSCDETTEDGTACLITFSPPKTSICVMGNCLCEIDADCNDGNACTVDTCNQVNGVCEHTPVADGTSCGGAAVCVAASCRDLECETDLDCNDFKDCTTDSCVSFGFCETPPVEDGTPCAGGECEAGECSLASSVVPCTEQAIRNAIAAGGGPYTFDCDGPTTVVTEAEIVINNNVILDGEGKLTVDGNGAHRVFTVLEAYPELRGMSITGGLGTDGTGGIFIAWGLTLKDCTVSDNGGYGIGSQGGLTLVNSIVSGNAEGGIRSDHMTLVNSIVSGNGGPGIESAGPNPVSLTNITVSGNTAGGIVCRCDGGQATLTGSRVTGNTGGSGVTLQGGEMIIVDSTISGNVNDSTAGGPFEQVGGGIRNHVGTMTLINSTVSGNTALLEGDGISSAAGLVNGEMDGVLKIIASTVSDEVHAYGAAAIFPSIEFTSTVMEGSCVETGNPATWVSNGHNIESPGNTCGFDQPTDQVNVSAEQLKLGPLQDNGGPTMTHALLPGSVAIDQIPEAECVDADGESLTTDQRGEPRPETGGTMCDVGAFEVQP